MNFLNVLLCDFNILRATGFILGSDWFKKEFNSLSSVGVYILLSLRKTPYIPFFSFGAFVAITHPPKRYPTENNQIDKVQTGYNLFYGGNSH